ncbi:MAG: methyl-accepting chemotaxis protein [Melioribacteraceae bacterium]
MTIYKNLKIRTKYFVPVVLSTIGFLFVIIYGIRHLNSSSDSFVQFINNDQALLLSLNDMYTQGLQSEQATRNILLNPSDKKAVTNYDKANEDFFAQLQLAKNASSGNSFLNSKLEEIEQMWGSIDNLKKQVQEAAVAGNSKEGINLLTNTETPKWREFKKQVLDLVAKKQKEINLKKVEVQENAHSALTNMITYSIVIVLFSFIIIFIAANAFVKPIFQLEINANKVAAGDTDVNIEIKSNDELGHLSKSFNTMVENIRNSMNEIKQKEIVAKEAAREAEEAKAIADGQKEYLSDSVKKILSEMNKFENGDMTVELEVENDDEIGKLFEGFNQAVNNVGNLISSVESAVQATASASNEISSSSEEMAAGAQEQSSQTTEVASAVEQMTKTIFETTKNSSNAAEAAKNAGSIAKEGGKVVNETIEGLNRVAQVVKRSAETVQELGKSSDQIGEIVQVIDDIADQTNLLALNAAIEAARAGEQGRGFAVVADEVRKLAERTTKATKEIATMIKQIQRDTEEAVISMKEGTKEVEKGKELADLAGKSLKEIISGSDEVVNIVTQVAAASEEQSATAEEISKNIEAISNVTQESASGVQQIARAAEDLNRLTVNLQELISRFKINESSRNNHKGVKKAETKNHLAIRSNGVLVHN